MPPYLSDPTMDIVEFANEYGRLLRSIEAAGKCDGVGVAESRVLRELPMHGATTTDLASLLAMDPGQLSRLNEGLQAKGLFRRDGRDGGRNRTWHLTEKGMRVAGNLRMSLLRAASSAFSNKNGSFARFIASAKQLGNHTYDASDSKPIIRGGKIAETGSLVAESAKSFVNGFYGYDETLVGHLHGIMSHALSGEHLSFVAEYDRALAGGIIVCLDRHERAATIPFFAIFNDYQGQGWGEALLGKAISAATEAKSKIIRAEMVLPRDSDSYLSRLRHWRLETSREVVICGAEVRAETWSIRFA